MKRFWLIIPLILSCLPGKAQNAQYGQYFFNGLYISPAYAGENEDLYLNTSYRSQWTGITGSPQTVSLTADGAVYNSRVGLGIVLQHDAVGAQSNTAVYGNYAYRIPLNDEGDSKLAFGLGFGFIQSGIDGSRLSPAQSSDNYIPSGFESVFLPDARFGILYRNKDFFVGVSADNLLANLVKRKSVNALLVPIPLPTEYFTAGVFLDLNDDIKFKPSVLIRDNPYRATNIDINSFFLLGEKVSLGITYRTDISLYTKKNIDTYLQKSSAAVFTAEFAVNGTFRIGYAFDYSLSKISSSVNGTHDMSLTFLLKKNKMKIDADR